MRPEPSPTLSSVTRRLYRFSLLDEIGPLFAVYTLLFVDHGLDASHISTVFVIWAAVAIALEIPSGALADLVDRRKLVAVALSVRAAGIAIWLIEPTYTGVLVGAALWALHTSLASGAWEALAHDELAALGEAHRYAPVMARAGQFNNLGIAAGTIVATITLGLGATIAVVGWITIAFHAISIHQVVSLPDVRWVIAAERAEQEPGHRRGRLAEWTRTMTDGVREIGSSRLLLGLVAVTALLEGLFVIDEFVPMLARNRGAPDSIVPLFVLVVWIGLLVGGEFAARRPNTSPLVLGLGLAFGATTMAVAVQSSAIGLLALVGVGYATHETIWVLGDARLQERIGARRRATVTSVRSFIGGVCAAVAFLVVAVLAGGDDPRRGLLVVLTVLFCTAIAATRLVPVASRSTERSAAPAHSAHVPAVRGDHGGGDHRSRDGNG